MNNLQHGMRSTQLVLPSESRPEFDKRKSDLLEVLKPRDAVESMLAERVVIRNWFRIRGERATTRRASEIVDEIVDGADDREAREVERLAALLEEGDPDAVRRLRAFPAGVAYLLQQWAIIKERLSRNENLLYTQRIRCFKLLARPALNALRDDPVATKWLRVQIGVLLGPDAALEDVADFLGGAPPEWMPLEEFTIRVTALRDSLLTREASFVMLKTYVSRAMSDLRAHQVAIQEKAERRLEDATAGAAVDATPEGTRLTNYILANEKGCDAALRRLELMRKPDRPGPKRGPKPPVAAPAEPKPELPTEPAAAEAPGPMPVPDAVSSDAQATVAAEVPADDRAPRSTIEAAEPTSVDEPALVTAEPVADFSTVEPIAESTPAEPVADFSTLEPIAEDVATEPDLERCGRHTDRLRKVSLHLEATYGAAVPSTRPSPNRQPRGGRFSGRPRLRSGDTGGASGAAIPRILASYSPLPRPLRKAAPGNKCRLLLRERTGFRGAKDDSSSKLFPGPCQVGGVFGRRNSILVYVSFNRTSGVC